MLLSYFVVVVVAVCLVLVVSVKSLLFHGSVLVTWCCTFVLYDFRLPFIVLGASFFQFHSRLSFASGSFSES